MPHIVETIVITRNTDGSPYLAPLGLIEEGERWIIAPFKPSRTLDNLLAHPYATASHTGDVRVFAGGVTGRKDWSTVAARHIPCARLSCCVSHWELEVEHVIDDALRPRFGCRRVHAEGHAPWSGYNRAQAAVIEGAVLVTRLDMLAREKIEAELAYLEIAIAKTAGPIEREAWGWLMEKVTAWRQTRGDA